MGPALRLPLQILTLLNLWPALTGPPYWPSLLALTGHPYWPSLLALLTSPYWPSFLALLTLPYWPSSRVPVLWCAPRRWCWGSQRAPGPALAGRHAQCRAPRPCSRAHVRSTPGPPGITHGRAPGACGSGASSPSSPLCGPRGHGGPLWRRLWVGGAHLHPCRGSRYVLLRQGFVGCLSEESLPWRVC